MRDAIRLFRRFLPPYKGTIAINIVFNILGAIFGIFSFISMIPLLRILLNKGTVIPEYRDIDISIIPFHIPREDIMNNLYAFIGNLSLEHGEFKALIFIGIFLLFMVLLKTGFTFAASYSMVLIRNSVVRDIRNKMYKRMIALPIGFFSEERKGDIIARVTGDVTEVEHSVMTSLDMFFKNPVIILLTISAMIFMSWQLTLFVFILFPVAGIVIGLIGRTLKKRSLKGQNKMGEILSTIEETISGLRVIKAFNAENVMQVKQSKQNNQYRRIMNSLMSRHALAHPTSELMGTMVIVMVMWYGGMLILNQKSLLDFEQFMIYLVLFYNIINPAKAFSSAFYNIQKGLASMERIDKVLDTEVTIRDNENPVAVSKFNNLVEYKNVWFKYNEEYVLNDVNLKIIRGQTIALVGQSGSGKSTLVDLLPRFYDIEKGEILFDGINVKKLKLKDLRGLLGIVNQEAILFNDTIHNNIAFGMEDVKEEDVVRAAKIANAHEFIIQTDNGYQTNIGDRGSKLSGGQRQRLSIARAILKNPPVLILDEATSALDTESERLVQEAIYNLMKDRTSIVIAHRLSTIRNVDRIFVLHKGKIIEKGTYEELLALNGEFKKLHDNQFN
ncbi:MAG: ABC transporter ATP-binding protein [Bacteroidales bacterium]|nr:ABC transporter ATP-binding protein [Bacteroidales bacterium]